MAVTMQVFLVCVCVQSWMIHQATAGDANSTVMENKKDGSYLLNLGQTFNDPLLRLIGRAFINREESVRQALASLNKYRGTAIVAKLQEDNKAVIERLCQSNPCGEWSEWTKCPVHTKQHFSMVTRNRTCGQNTSLCTYHTGEQEFKTTERKVCEGFCRADYNFTGDFCLMFYDAALVQSDAENVCQNDSSHLVNINTQKKSDAVHDLLSSHGHSGTIWVDGNRAQIGAPWVFAHGSSPDFDNWWKGEPSNRSSEFCKIEEVQGGSRMWCDRECTDKYKFVCEMAAYV